MEARAGRECWRAVSAMGSPRGGSLLGRRAGPCVPASRACSRPARCSRRPQGGALSRLRTAAAATRARSAETEAAAAAAAAPGMPGRQAEAAPGPGAADFGAALEARLVRRVLEDGEMCEPRQGCCRPPTPAPSSPRVLGDGYSLSPLSLWLSYAETEALNRARFDVRTSTGPSPCDGRRPPLPPPFPTPPRAHTAQADRPGRQGEVSALLDLAGGDKHQEAAHVAAAMAIMSQQAQWPAGGFRPGIRAGRVLDPRSEVERARARARARGRGRGRESYGEGESERKRGEEITCICVREKQGEGGREGERKRYRDRVADRQR